MNYVGDLHFISLELIWWKVYLFFQLSQSSVRDSWHCRKALHALNVISKSRLTGLTGREREHAD